MIKINNYVLKKQLLFCFIGITLLLGFESKVNAVPIANTAKSLSAAPTTYTWTGAADVKWSNPANWLPATGYPGMNVGVYDDVVIGLGAHMPTVDVTIGNIQTIDFTANTTLTLAAGLTVRTSSTIDAGVTLTTGVINFIPSLPYYFFAGDLTVKNGGGVIMLTNSYLYAVNISVSLRTFKCLERFGVGSRRLSATSQRQSSTELVQNKRISLILVRSAKARIIFSAFIFFFILTP